MKDETLLELAAKWERIAKPPEVSNGSPDAAISNAMDSGFRTALKVCAIQLRELVRLLGTANE